MKYYLTPTRLAALNKSAEQVLVRRQTRGYLVQSMWKEDGVSSKKLKMELLFDPAILFLGMLPKNPET